MWRDIRLGLHADGDGAAGWARVLRQECLAWEAVDRPDRPIVLFSGRLPCWCDAFVAGGGVAVIDEAPVANALLGVGVTATLLRFHPPQRDREAAMPCLARAFAGKGEGEIRLHENRKARDGQLADVRPAGLVRRHGRGWLIFTGLPLARHLIAAGDSLRAFADASEMTERVATADKAEIVDMLGWMLRRAFACLGLPYLRVARYPGGARSVFVLRVDVDGLFGANCRRIAEIARAHGVACSFYFNASLCRAHPGTLSREWLSGHEIGHHGDRHDVFDTCCDNAANLRAGMDWLARELGGCGLGCVAPRGLWNPALDRAMAELAVPYSSDFGLDFDGLPFVTPAGVLQVPVHPYSPERHRIYREDCGLGPPGARAVLDHYLSALSRQSALGRPVHLYGHPEMLGTLAETVLPALFAAARDAGLPAMTLGDFADWWRKRSEGCVMLAVDDATGQLRAETDAEALEACADVATQLTLHDTEHRLDAGAWTLLRTQHGDAA